MALGKASGGHPVNPAVPPARTPPAPAHHTPAPVRKPVAAAPGATIPTSAKTIIAGFLEDTGLGGLTDWAWNQYVKLGGGQAAIDAIKLELPQTSIFKQRFPAIEQMRKAGIQPVTVSQYLDYENTLSQSLKSAGLPPAFWSRNAQHSTFDDMVTKLLSNNVSVVEANDRVQQGVSYMQQAPPEVRDAFGQLYGAHGDGALTALFLDPGYTLPTLQKMERSAFTVGVGAQQGIGGITADTAGKVGQLGLTDDAMRQQLTQLGQSGLLEGRVGEHLTADQLVAGTFGTSAQSADQLAKVVQERKATSAGITGTAFRPATSQGVPGVGTAPG